VPSPIIEPDPPVPQSCHGPGTCAIMPVTLAVLDLTENPQPNAEGRKDHNATAEATHETRRARRGKGVPCARQRGPRPAMATHRVAFSPHTLRACVRVAVAERWATTACDASGQPVELHPGGAN